MPSNGCVCVCVRDFASFVYISKIIAAVAICRRLLLHALVEPEFVPPFDVGALLVRLCTDDQLNGPGDHFRNDQ